MINISGSFHQALSNDKREYLNTATITLKDGTILNVTNENIWEGGLSFEDAVSADNNFQVGAAIVNKQTLVLNNMYDDYSSYDFQDAVVVTNIGLVVDEETGTVERIKKGTFNVDEADYDEVQISLSLLDNMSKFELPFGNVSTSFPVTAGVLISDICRTCGVSLGTAAFPHSTFEFEEGPEDNKCSCREVVSWVAQAVGCFARCNADGALELRWFNRSGLESTMSGLDGGVFDNNSSSRYTTGDAANGGTFNPWNTGYAYDGGTFAEMSNDIHYIASSFSHSVSVDDVVITGVRILIKSKDNDSASGINEHFVGSAGYIIEISDNPLITEDNVQDIITWLGASLIGFAFRKANLTAPSDPSIEAGDVGVYFDGRGNHHPIVISRVTFSPGDSQTIVSSAQTPSRNSSSKASAATRDYIELRKRIKDERTAWEQAEEDLRDAIAEASGLYQTDVTDAQTGATIHYLHNKGPNGTATDRTGLNSSDIRIMVSSNGVTMTANGTDPNPTWYGLTVDGILIASVMKTIGINFNWGTGGTLTLGGQDNVNGLLRMLNASGTEVGKWSNAGIDVKKGNIEIGDNNNSSVSVNEYGVSGEHNQENEYRLGYYNPNNVWETHPALYFSNNNTNRASQLDRYGLALRGFAGNTQVHSLFLTPVSFLHVYNTNERSIDYDLSDSSSGFVNMKGIGLKVTSPSHTITIDYSTGTITAESFVATGTKPRLVDTEDYGKRLLYCYETPTPMFGDIGEGVIGDDGLCYIWLDPVFTETVDTGQYQIFLQTYGEGTAYIKERKPSYFVVSGTPTLEFGWEVKAKQKDYDHLRLEWKSLQPIEVETEDYGELGIRHIEQVDGERGVKSE